MTLKHVLSRKLASRLKWMACALIVTAALGLALTAPAPVGAGKADAVEERAQSDLPVAGETSAPESPVAVPDVFLGLSGNLRVWIATPESIASHAELEPLLTGISYSAPGVYRLSAKAPDGESLSVLSLTALSVTEGARFGSYRIGAWPSGTKYQKPLGFIQVTRENRATPVSKHFELGDFVTHDQQDVWPKVLVLRPALLDKLELLQKELDREGLPSRLHVMSGFRTPQYNAQGVGRGGRATHSRHMYGDASDVFVDEDGNGMMDDLDRDGKITVRDALVLRAAAERVEAAHPELVGGIGAYPANGVHGPFVHVDTRGYRARWGANPVVVAAAPRHS